MSFVRAIHNRIVEMADSARFSIRSSNSAGPQDFLTSFTREAVRHKMLRLTSASGRELAAGQCQDGFDGSPSGLAVASGPADPNINSIVAATRPLQLSTPPDPTQARQGNALAGGHGMGRRPQRTAVLAAAAVIGLVVPRRPRSRKLLSAAVPISQ